MAKKKKKSTSTPSSSVASQREREEGAEERDALEADSSSGEAEEEVVEEDAAEAQAESSSDDEAGYVIPQGPRGDKIKVWFDEAEIPVAERGHSAAPVLLSAWELYAIGDYNAAREAIAPISSGELDAPASYRSAATKLDSVTHIETASLIFGACMVAFFLFIVFVVY